MAVLFIIAGLIGGAVYYWLLYLDAFNRGIMITSPEERIWALIVLSAMLAVGALLWPRSRHKVRTLDYVVPASMFSLGWVGLCLLTYHCRLGVRLGESMQTDPPEYCREGQLYGALGVLGGIVYYLLYRWWPPPMSPAAPPQNWRRHIQHTLLYDIVCMLDRWMV